LQKASVAWSISPTPKWHWFAAIGSVATSASTVRSSTSKVLTPIARARPFCFMVSRAFHTSAVSAGDAQM